MQGSLERAAEAVLLQKQLLKLARCQKVCCRKSRAGEQSKETRGGKGGAQRATKTDCARCRAFCMFKWHSLAASWAAVAPGKRAQWGGFPNQRLAAAQPAQRSRLPGQPGGPHGRRAGLPRQQRPRREQPVLLLPLRHTRTAAPGGRPTRRRRGCRHSSRCTAGTAGRGGHSMRYITSRRAGIWPGPGPGCSMAGQRGSRWFG